MIPSSFRIRNQGILRLGRPLRQALSVCGNAHTMHTKGTRLSMKLEGGCLCGKVRFTVNQPPLRTLACHCTFCQRLTGSSFYAESIFLGDSVQFNEGEL